jgi:hypothetical protein
MAEFEKTGERDHLYLEAAGGVIAQYLGRNYFEPNIDPFLGSHRKDENDQIWYGFPLRVILIGETLFMLRNCSAFEEICARLKERDLRSSYYEMLVAKMFIRVGFDVLMRKESEPGIVKKKGEEFDFTAVRGRTSIAVEVTALKEKEFYEKTAANALHHKRTQLPKDKPTIIFCVLPPHWENLGFNLNEWTANVANEFFLSGSRRVNKLVFYIERHIDRSSSGHGGGFITVALGYDHPNPYFSYNFDPIVELRGRSEITALQMGEAFENPESMAAILKITRAGEFFEWVDSLHDE